MRPLLLFLIVAIVLGFRSNRLGTPIPRGLLFGSAVVLALALYSQRFLA